MVAQECEFVFRYLQNALILNGLRLNGNLGYLYGY